MKAPIPLNQIVTELFDNINYLLHCENKSNVNISICKGSNTYYGVATVKEDCIEYKFSSDKSDSVTTFTTTR